jgi:23S rRNA pseudouridine2605 synthase
MKKRTDKLQPESTEPKIETAHEAEVEEHGTAGTEAEETALAGPGLDEPEVDAPEAESEAAEQELSDEGDLEDEDDSDDEEDEEEESDDEDEDEEDSEDEEDEEDDSEDEDEEEEEDSEEVDEAETEAEDASEPETADAAASGEEEEPESKPRPPAKLERLQKILAKAGVSSRRRAEELITQGRVQVNGKIITELGTKADAGRDHIRVDGKLLQGEERLRYFMLNKPKGFVTTVKDPEGRATVMQFFEKMNERLYPVGRLDYQSEGLLLMTNDGELANKLTKASSGVEKTYLVKVAGQPTEGELEALRSGVTIERGKPGSAKVRTSPARIRQVRQGDNPWYEVVLIEGRNRELRKMFEEVGHFVEKIRRIGYGPLVLDQEPGSLRELQPDELDALRKASEGKLRTPKAKDVRRRNLIDSQLPTVKPKASRPNPSMPFASKPYTRPNETLPSEDGSAGAARPSTFRPKPAFGADRTARPAGGEFRPAARSGSRPDSRPAGRPAWKKDDRPGRPPARFGAGAGRPASASAGEERPPSTRPYTRPSSDRPAAGRSYGSKPAGGGYGDKPAGRSYGAKPTGKPYGDRPAGRSYGDKPGGKPAWKKEGSGDRPDYKRSAAPRPAAPRREVMDLDDMAPRQSFKIEIEPIQRDDRPSRPSAPSSYPGRSGSARPSSGRPSGGRTSGGHSYAGAGRPGAGRPSSDRSSSDRPSSGKPFRSESGLSRPFSTSSGKPRAGGARPSSKPGSSRPYSAGPKRPFRSQEGAGSYTPRPSGGSSAGPSRPYTPRTEGASDAPHRGSKPYPNSASRAERKAGPDWKPKTSFGAGKPSSGGYSKPKPGGFSKSGHKGKPSGPRLGGKNR